MAANYKIDGFDYTYVLMLTTKEWAVLVSAISDYSTNPIYNDTSRTTATKIQDALLNR